MAIKLVQWEGSTVTPTDDRILYDNGFCGIIKGCEISHIGANKLRIAQGYIKMRGGLIEVEQTDVECEVSRGGTVNGQIWIRLNFDSITPAAIMTEAAAVLTTLTKDVNANFDNGVYELQLATYKINENTISQLVVNDLAETNFVTLPVNGWTTSAPYTQTIKMPRMDKKSRPFVAMGTPGTPSAASYKDMNKAYACIDRLVTDDGTVTFYCYNKRPATAINLIIKGA